MASSLLPSLWSETARPIAFCIGDASGFFTDTLNGLIRFFRVIGNSLGAHTPGDFVDFSAVPLNLFEMAFRSFRDLGNGPDTALRFGLDFPEPCERYVSTQDNDNGEESKNHGHESQPPVDGARPVIQKLTSEFVEAALNIDLDLCRDRRPGGRTGLHGRIVTRAVLAARWTGVDFLCLGLCWNAFNGGIARLRECNHWNRRRYRSNDKPNSGSGRNPRNHLPSFLPNQSAHSPTPTRQDSNQFETAARARCGSTKKFT